MSGKTFKAMSGTLQLKANHKWTSYDFKTYGMYFHYFGAKSLKAVGQLFKTQIREVKLAGKRHKGADNCFEVHHTGSGGSPWILSAASREDCIKWMECLQPGSSALLKAPPSLSAHPPSPHLPSGSSLGYQYNGHQQFPYNGYQYNGNLHKFMNRGNAHHTQDFSQSMHGSIASFSGTLPSQSTIPISAHDRNALSTPVTMSREEFFRQAGNEPTQNNRATPQGGVVQNDYVRYGSSKPVEPVDEPPEPEEDDRYVANIHARSLTCPKSCAPPIDKHQQRQQQQQQQKPKPIPRQRPQIQPRTNPPQPRSPPSPESYEYMSSKGVPSPEEQNFCGDPNETLGSNLPPMPPMRPRHTLQGVKSDFLEGDGDVYDGRMDTHRESLSLSYVDPTELNTTKLPRGGSLDGPTSPLPHKHITNQNSQSSENAYMDFLRYFSPEQLRQLMDMFKEVVGVQDRDSPQQPQILPSSSELVSVLKQTSQNLPDQILNQQDEYIVGEDDSTKKWAQANSKPLGKRLDKHQDINDPIYQMQGEAFTIQKEALSGFRVIGKGQYGVVEAALYRPSPGSTPMKVAIKRTKETCSQLDKDNFYKEIVVMAQFMHPNIVKVFGSVDKGVSSPWLVLEFLSNGDLKSFLKCNSRPVYRLVKYMVDIAMGMHYLSEKGYVHRDLAARNIFMDENELCKVGDFGLLRETSSRDDDEEKHYVMQSKLALPVRWMAVECLTKQIFSSASDVWSFGVLMWELFNPTIRPYKSMDNVTVIASVSAGQRLDIPKKCPKKVGQIMHACWNADQTKRPSFLVIANLLCRCVQQETPSRT